jgi:hypothetical protein
MKKYKSGSPWERLQIDITGPLTETETGNRYIIVVTDCFTKWTQTYAVRHIDTESVAKPFVENWVLQYGPPKMLHSDQGRQFESALFKKMCELLGIDKTRSTAFHPESNGQVERFNRTLGVMLAIYAHEHPRKWDTYLPYATSAYRATPHSSTGFSPNRMVLGHETTMPMEVLMGNPNPQSWNDIEDYVDELRVRLETAYEHARKAIGRQAETQKRYFDHKASITSLKLGQPVWLLSMKKKPGVSRKLTSPWVQGYVVVDVLDDVTVKIQASPRSKPLVVHVNRLMPYEGPDPPTWFTAHCESS